MKIIAGISSKALLFCPVPLSSLRSPCTLRQKIEGNFIQPIIGQKKRAGLILSWRKPMPCSRIAALPPAVRGESVKRRKMLLSCPGQTRDFQHTPPFWRRDIPGGPKWVWHHLFLQLQSPLCLLSELAYLPRGKRKRASG